MSDKEIFAVNTVAIRISNEIAMHPAFERAFDNLSAKQRHKFQARCKEIIREELINGGRR